MIVLQPHRLDAGMLVDVSVSPAQRLRVGLVNQRSNFGPNQGNPAEAAMKAISREYRFRFGFGRHSRFDALILGNEWKRVRDWQWPTMRSTLSPKGFSPFGNRRNVCHAEEFRRQLVVACQVGRYSGIQITRGIIDFQDWVAETFPKIGLLAIHGFFMMISALVPTLKSFGLSMVAPESTA